MKEKNVLTLFSETNKTKNQIIKSNILDKDNNNIQKSFTETFSDKIKNISLNNFHYFNYIKSFR